MGEIGLSEEEMDYEYRFWQNYVRSRIPRVFPGMREILARQ